MPSMKKRATNNKKKKAAGKAARKSRKVTLKHVSVRAMEDPVFWKALRYDAQQALADNGMALAAADARQLRAIMELDGKTIHVDLDGLMRAHSRIRQAGLPLGWIGLWAFDQGIVEPRQPRVIEG